MEMHQLKYFEASARLGSLSAAALACHVSQPSLSVQLRKLEEEVGGPLLVRGARGVTLTPAGERLLRTVRRINAELGELRRDFRLRDYASVKPLRLGVQPLLASETLAEPLKAALDAGVVRKVEIRERPRPRLLEDLLTGELDLAMLTLPESLPRNLGFEVLLRSGYAAYCCADHPLARHKSITLTQVLQHRLLLFADPNRMDERIAELAARERVGLDVVLTSDQALTVFEMASVGLGVALLPDILRSKAARRSMVAVPLREPKLRARIGFVWRQSGDNHAAITPLIRHFGEHRRRLEPA